MKKLSLILALFLLAGCATNSHYPRYGDGDTYLGVRSYPDIRHRLGYDSLYMYGMYPWWAYGFHTPYFYPYHFTYYHPFYDPFYGRYFYAGWSPSWPYYDGFYGRYGWAYFPYRQPPVTLPVHDGPMTPVPPPVGRVIADEERRRAIDRRGLARETMYRPPGKQQPGSVPPYGFTRREGMPAPGVKTFPGDSTRAGPSGVKSRTFAPPAMPASAAPRFEAPAAAPAPARPGRVTRFESVPRSDAQRDQ